MDLERKLQEYRAKKRREQVINDTKDKIKGFFSRPKKQDVALLNSNKDLEKEELLVCEKEVVGEVEPEEIDDNINCCSYVDLIYYGLCFILWVTVYVIFIKLQFGTVYFVLSALIGMYLNTRTTPKKENEISAYSVFNENCKSIDGTLKGEQFEREMGYRM